MESKPSPDADYDALARRYLELWQEQIAAWAQQNPAGGGADAEKLAAQVAGQFAGLASAWMEMMQGALKGAAGGHDGAGQAATAGSPAPAAADGAGGLDPAMLLRRIDELERRLAVYEARGETRGEARGETGAKSAARKPARRTHGRAAGGSTAKPNAGRGKKS